MREGEEGRTRGAAPHPARGAPLDPIIGVQGIIPCPPEAVVCGIFSKKKDHGMWMLTSIHHPRRDAMVKSKSIVSLDEVKGLLERDNDFLRTMVQTIVQQTLEEEMEAAIGAGKSVRTDTRVS